MAVAKHIIVRAMDGQVEHFHGNNLKAEVEADGCLYVYEVDNPSGTNEGIFRRWEYVRREE